MPNSPTMVEKGKREMLKMVNKKKITNKKFPQSKNIHTIQNICTHMNTYATLYICTYTKGYGMILMNFHEHAELAMNYS